MCYCGSFSLPVFFGKSFINFPKLFLELGSACLWRNERAANRFQKKTVTLSKVVLFLHPSKQYQHSTKTGSTHMQTHRTLEGQQSEGAVLRCPPLWKLCFHQSPRWDHCLSLLNVASRALGWTSLQEEVRAGTEAEECHMRKLSYFPERLE